jgi:diguanylate cyclase (GGDEF)-like protein
MPELWQRPAFRRARPLLGAGLVVLATVIVAFWASSPMGAAWTVPAALGVSGTLAAVAAVLIGADVRHSGSARSAAFVALSLAGVGMAATYGVAPAGASATYVLCLWQVALPAGLAGAIWMPADRVIKAPRGLVEAAGAAAGLVALALVGVVAAPWLPKTSGSRHQLLVELGPFTLGLGALAVIAAALGVWGRRGGATGRWALPAATAIVCAAFLQLLAPGPDRVGWGAGWLVGALGSLTVAAPVGTAIRALSPEPGTSSSGSRAADEDALTGLMKASTILAFLDDTLAAMPASLLVVDIDYLRSVNDAFGREAGDEVLSAVAKRLRNCLRRSDRAGRLDGEEFLVVVPTPNPLIGDEVGQRILEALRSHPVRLSTGQRIDVRVSIGTATARFGEPSLTVLARADLAMAAAKHQGRDQQYAWHPGLSDNLGTGSSAGNA